MNNLHRELAPVSSAAWAQIEEEAARTLKRHLAGRRVVDVNGPSGDACSAVGTGHLAGDRGTAAGRPGPAAAGRPADRTPGAVPGGPGGRGRRGAGRAGLRLAAGQGRRPADRVRRGPGHLRGLPGGADPGHPAATSNPPMTLPADVLNYPEAIAEALRHLREAGVNGPYSVLLSADAYTAVSETRDHGYPIHEHIKRLISGEIIWAPAIEGAFVLTTRGGDFAPVPRPGHLDRLPEPRRDQRGAVPPGDDDVPGLHRPRPSSHWPRRPDLGRPGAGLGISPGSQRSRC